MVETLTHAFLTCPAVVPVVDWLFDTWRSLTGMALPRRAELLLADDPSFGWPPDAGAGALQMWTRLRVCTLGAVWQARCSRVSSPQSLARRAVTQAVEHLLEAIRRDWQRTQEDVRLLDAGAFCNDWWRGVDARLSVDAFVQQWTRPPVFCRVVGPRPAPGAADTRRLELVLELDAPRPRPA